jgi:hypothetical protein
MEGQHKRRLVLVSQSAWAHIPEAKRLIGNGWLATEREVLRCARDEGFHLRRDVAADGTQRLLHQYISPFIQGCAAAEAHQLP